MVADRQQRDHEEGDAERHPDQLLLGEVVRLVDRLAGEVDAVDHREAEPVERGDHGEQHRVGVRRDQADHDVRADHQAGQPAAVPEDVGRHLALDADADRGVRPDADGEGEDEQEELRAPPAAVHESHQGRGLGHQPVVPGRRGLGLLVRREVLHGLLGVGEVLGVDAVLDLAGVEVAQPVQLDVGGLVGLGEVEAADRGVEAAEDHDRAVLLADVVLVLGPRPERPRPRPSRGRRPRRRRRAAWPRRSGAAAAVRSARSPGRRRWRRTARRRAGRPGPGRARRCRRSGARGRARRCGRAAAAARPPHRRPGPRARRPARSPASWTSATTQVTLSLLPASRLLRTSSTAAYSGLPVERMSAIRASVEDAARAVAADQEPVAGDEVEDEEVGLAVADRVDRPHDQVAVRVDPRLRPR